METGLIQLQQFQRLKYLCICFPSDARYNFYTFGFCFVFFFLYQLISRSSFNEHNGDPRNVDLQE